MFALYNVQQLFLDGMGHKGSHGAPAYIMSQKYYIMQIVRYVRLRYH